MTDVEAVAGRIVEELGVTLSTLTMAVGLRTGLWAALAGAGPLTPEQLAQRTGVAPALAREWCRTQAAGGYLRLAGEGFALPDEVTAALVHGPMGELVDAATMMITATAMRFDAFVRAFGGGRGFGWDERTGEHAHGVDRFSRAAIAPDFFTRAIFSGKPMFASTVRYG